ncbi:MAG: hypothetical protein Q8Q09_10650 [Deltaproteobacteria bacterium]|nr:hypothetical protein [Deltaproteobacteria bacterium]
MFAEFSLPSLLAARDIVGRLQCSRSQAYEHLRACALRYHGRPATRRGMLRVSREAWAKYETEVLACGSIIEAEFGTRTSAAQMVRGSKSRQAAPIERPRKRSRSSGSESSLIPTPQRYRERP